MCVGIRSPWPVSSTPVQRALNAFGDLISLPSCTWGEEYSRPVTSCCTTAAFPGISLASTGTPKSMACGNAHVTNHKTAKLRRKTVWDTLWKKKKTLRTLGWVFVEVSVTESINFTSLAEVTLCQLMPSARLQSETCGRTNQMLSPLWIVLLDCV